MDIQRYIRRISTTLLVWFLAGVALAADFRVENTVYVGGEKDPVARSTTIFHEDVVYDYLAEPAEVTIFDPARHRFVLLDTTRRIKTELTAETVDKAIETLKKRLATSSDPSAQFLRNPSFDQRVDESTGDLTFNGEWMSYRVSGVVPDDAEAVRQYREFSDAYAKLNTFIRPQSRPPFARMIVNEALEKRSEIPVKVEMTVTLKKGLSPKRVSMRSEHQLITQLAESDRRHVAQTGEFVAMFNAVSFSDYEARSKSEGKR
jgi:hypothetical protein